MQIYLKDAKKTLARAGYEMQGESNSFKRHVKVNEWFHAYVSTTYDDVVSIHYDISKQEDIGLLYKKHKTNQGHESLRGEVHRIRQSEPKTIFEIASIKVRVRFKKFLKKIKRKYGHENPPPTEDATEARP
jgi:pyruvate-formate lyase